MATYKYFDSNKNEIIVILSMISIQNMNAEVRNELLTLSKSNFIYYIYWTHKNYLTFLTKNSNLLINKSIWTFQKINNNLKYVTLANIMPSRFNKLSTVQESIKFLLLKTILLAKIKRRTIWFFHPRFYKYINRLEDTKTIFDTFDLLINKKDITIYERQLLDYKLTPIFYNDTIGEKNNLKIVTWSDDIRKRIIKTLNTVNKL